ncbi:MAG: hypothetical protein ACYTGZ_10445 [Planctomycetota bacterium]|jgi:hypothetical protein
MRRLALLLLACTAAHAGDLEAIAPLIGGQWVAVSRLPDGQQIRSRTVWTWGLGRRLVRMRQFVMGKEGEVQRYETVVFRDPANNKLLYRVFAEAGELSRGEVKVIDGVIAFEQPAKTSFPAMRTAYRITGRDSCATRISFRSDGNWKPRIDSKSHREAITPARKLRLEGGANPLAGVAVLVDTKTWRWSLHERLLQGVTPDGSDGFITFDPLGGALRFLEVADDGSVRDGTVEVSDQRRESKGIRIMWNLGADRRRVFHWTGPGEGASWIENKNGSVWARIPRARLVGVAWLVGRQWEAKAKLPDGRAIESRMVIDWIGGRHAMRMRSYVKQGAREHLQYQSLLYEHPGKPELQSITWSLQGRVYRATGTVKDGVLTLEQPAQHPAPPSRNVYRQDPDSPDRYFGEVFWRRNGEWKRVMAVASTRGDYTKPNTEGVPEERGALEPLARLTGGFWSWKATVAGRPVEGSVRYEYHLHGRLVTRSQFVPGRGRPAYDGHSYLWVEPKTKRIRSLSVYPTGGVGNGSFVVTPNGWARNWRELHPKGRTNEQREEGKWTGADSYESRVFRRRDGKWRPSLEGLTAKRLR